MSNHGHRAWLIASGFSRRSERSKKQNSRFALRFSRDDDALPWLPFWNLPQERNLEIFKLDVDVLAYPRAKMSSYWWNYWNLVSEWVISESARGTQCDPTATNASWSEYVARSRDQRSSRFRVLSVIRGIESRRHRFDE